MILRKPVFVWVLAALSLTFAAWSAIRAADSSWLELRSYFYIPPWGTRIYVEPIPFYPSLGIVVLAVLIPYFLGYWMGYRTGPTRVVFVDKDPPKDGLDTSLQN